MSLIEKFKEKGEQCELCSSTDGMSIYLVPPKTDENIDNCIYICNTCKTQIEEPDQVDPNHWRCLNDSMWSERSPVKVVAFRLLHQLKSEGWPQDLIDMMYLEEDERKWAHETIVADEEQTIQHKDSNGARLAAGDNVVLIKDLNVKGANFTAKRGTAVRNISLVNDNEEQIEGKVNGQQIVILTQYVKKS